MTQFFKYLCEDSEIQHILASVRNESGVLADSYGHVNIKIHYYSTIWQTIMMGCPSKHF